MTSIRCPFDKTAKVATRKLGQGLARGCKWERQGLYVVEVRFACAAFVALNTGMFNPEPYGISSNLAEILACPWRI